jgi:four helix bundle protein
MEAGMRKVFDHERLEVYGAAIEFVVLAGRILEGVPRGRSYVGDQLRRAATSIVLNIAEGAGEIYPSDKARFYRFACRSATECAAVLDVCRRTGLSREDQLDEGRDLLLRIVPMLVRLCKQMERGPAGTGSGSGSGTDRRRDPGGAAPG